MKIYNNSIKAFIFVILGLSASCSFANLAIPRPEQMIKDSTLIVEGALIVDQGVTSIKVHEVLKGDAIIGETLLLFSEHNPVGFDLTSMATAWSGKTAVMLGIREENNKVVLPWLQFSIWPMGSNSKPLSSSLMGSRSFVKEILDYLELAKKGESFIVPVMISDLENPNKSLSVLGFLNAFSDADILDEDSRNGMMYIAMTTLLSANNYNPAVVDLLSSMAPELPASLALQYFINAANMDNENSSLARSNAASILRSRRMLSRDSDSNLSDLKNDMQTNESKLRCLAAKRALHLFDSPIPAVQKRASKILYQIHEGREAKNGEMDQALDKKAYWEAQIKKQEE